MPYVCMKAHSNGGMPYVCMKAHSNGGMSYVCMKAHSNGDMSDGEVIIESLLFVYIALATPHAV